MKSMQLIGRLGLLATVVAVASCVVVPTTDTEYVAKCEISTDRKTLRIVDLFKETNSYYNITTGLILVPISGIVSGAYVAVHNTYRLGKETIVCGKGAGDDGLGESAEEAI
ncbi:hypothetical protein [Halioxenophilus aromaticivorans]|uniref:Lipoprotein n=1 Tax=Halioxenophilus aromaticivorans TaxID=1306992 RepID=A0AAV3U410_9ALTE